MSQFLEPAAAALAQPAYLIACCTILGLLIGSFLNVVAYRLPLMFDRDCDAFCASRTNSADAEAPVDQDRFDLLYPPSTCPGCNARIKPWHNVPVFGWLLLRGRCVGCENRISPRYPIVEATCGALCGLLAWHYGLSHQLLAALLLTWLLIPLILIDFDRQLLPDAITLPGLWLGLAFNLYTGLVSLQSAVIGAMAGYLSLWLVYHGFRLITGKQGMGYGDFKLLAMLGAWLGWQMLPLIVLLSSLLGAVLGIVLIACKVMDRSKPMPFGPWLALAGWVAMVWGESINSSYLQIYIS